MLTQCWTKRSRRDFFFFYSTLLKLRPAESFSLGLSSCSWASRISTSCSIRRTEELTSPANTGPCVWRASSLAKLAAFSPLRIWKQQQGKGVSETRKQGGLEMAPQREAEMMRTKYTIQLWSTVTGLAQNERKVVYRTQVNRDWMFSREHNGMTARDMPQKEEEKKSYSTTLLSKHGCKWLILLFILKPFPNNTQVIWLIGE